ncbi:MAG: c-type cytochrome [Pirellulales bacterium]|nr:c-type cytochrome [Pirellulales bacterium]
MPFQNIVLRSILLMVLAANWAAGGTAAADETAKKPSREAFELSSSATPADKIHVPEGFQVELLYSVPKDREGSWVNLCTDPRGRLIVSDENGGLYRVSLADEGAAPIVADTKTDSSRVRVERIPAKVRGAQGLLWAFDSLYVMMNRDRKQSGLYRVTDSDGDGELDLVKRLQHVEGDGEHGPHAVVLAPDGKSLYVVCGNNSLPVPGTESRVPEIWDEDQLLPRIYGVGFMRGMPAPAGAIYQVDPDGKNWQRISSGYRNPFDIAFNADGELFTYDADMEWDIGAPWYRPTRVCHVSSGTDWGWRNGSAKWPVYYADTLPPVVNTGLGSPTGITFGYGAKFPAKYQNALFICDWTYGKMYAIHLQPEGSSYAATSEEFMWATPLPLTDAVVNQRDGAMYFLIGGRLTQSGLYRLTYVGSESTARADGHQPNQEQRALRRELETLHVGDHPDAVEKAWPHLGSSDRFLRSAARTAIEHRPLAEWESRALAEQNPQTLLEVLLALVRKVPRSYKPKGPDLDTPVPTFSIGGALPHRLQGQVFLALDRLDWETLSDDQRLQAIRVCELAFYRLGAPEESVRDRVIARLDSIYPARDARANGMLTELMCYLQAPSAARKGMALVATAPAQEEQINLVRSLRYLKVGWTPELHRQLLEWFVHARQYRGGNNFPTFMEELRNDCLANISEAERKELGELAAPKLQAQALPVTPPRPFVKEWKMEEVLPLLSTKLKGRDFKHGKAMFAAANCYACHHFAGDGGAVGPDLTGLAGRFSPRDILESVMEPSKVVSDQYQAVVITTSGGQVVTGRITNFNKEGIMVNTNMQDPNAIVTIDRPEIESMEPSPTSMMPAGLLNTLSEAELLDLMAFLLSHGDEKNSMFRQ